MWAAFAFAKATHTFQQKHLWIRYCTSSNMAYMLIFLLKKNVSSFCICKSYSHFFSKNIYELDIVLTRPVNILTSNELVKLTTLWTTGPWSGLLYSSIGHFWTYWGTQKNNQTVQNGHVDLVLLETHIKRYSFSCSSDISCIHIRDYTTYYA